jgi:hypothetical protein
MTRRIPSLLALGAALALPGTAAGQTVVATGAKTAVREYAGTLVFSQFDRASGAWYLSVSRAGAAAERLPVAPSPRRFEADIGPDAHGRPALVYERCSGGAPSAPTGCDLYVYTLADATGERPVATANDPLHDDVEPTLWRGRIAWARVYGSGAGAQPVVYTRRLSAPASTRSTRLPGVPRRRCAAAGLLGPGRVCALTTERAVDALELRGDHLAALVTYACRACSGIATRELRLDDLRRSSARQVAVLATGLAAQALIGPSFFGPRLAWYKACRVPDAACRAVVGPFRYSLTTHRYEKGTPGPIAVEGFADAGSVLYENVGCAPSPEEPSGPDCRIEAVPPPRYSPTRAPLG